MLATLLEGAAAPMAMHMEALAMLVPTSTPMNQSRQEAQLRERSRKQAQARCSTVYVVCSCMSMNVHVAFLCTWRVAHCGKQSAQLHVRAARVRGERARAEVRGFGVHSTSGPVRTRTAKRTGGSPTTEAHKQTKKVELVPDKGKAKNERLAGSVPGGSMTLHAGGPLACRNPSHWMPPRYLPHRMQRYPSPPSLEREALCAGLQCLCEGLALDG